MNIVPLIALACLAGIIAGLASLHNSELGIVSMPGLGYFCMALYMITDRCVND